MRDEQRDELRDEQRDELRDEQRDEQYQRRGGREATSSSLIRAAGGQKKSCLDLAENWAADSLWVGAHR